MKKILVSVIAVLFIAILTVGVTYSFFLVSASGNTSKVAGNAISHNIIFTKGANLTGSLDPSNSRDNSMYTSASIRVTSNSTKPLVDVYINIENIASELGISALKWEVEATKGGNSVTLSPTSGDFASCSHNSVLGSCVTGDRIYVASGYELDTVDTEFKVYIWLDGNEINTDISNATLNASLGAEISKFTGTVLPLEYQQVEYVHFSGNQYINTNENASTYGGNYMVEIEEKHASTSTAMYLFGCGAANTAEGSRCNIRISGSTAKNVDFYVNKSPPTTQGANGISITNKLNLNSRNYIKFTVDTTNVYRKMEVNGTVQESTAAFYSQPTTTFRIAAYNTTTTYTGDIYSVKLYGNGNLIRNFVPCYRRSDGKVGFYDTKNDVFYINGKSGADLTAGPNINA